VERLTAKEEKLFKEKEEHVKNSVTQMRFYLSTRHTVESDQFAILIISDFTKFYQNGKRYNDLMISILFRNPQTGKHEWIYLDFIEQGGGSKQDFYFVRSVWMYLLGKR
jgi:hypothetical protein